MSNQRLSSPILPGSAIGVLGSGQLGRMFAIAARRMGYRVHTYSPDEDTPTGQVADVEVQGSYDDLDSVRVFARNVSAVTFEFENVPAATAAAAAEFAPVRPGGNVLHITQHRLREKTFLRSSGLPVTPFERVSNPEELQAAIGRLGLPAVLKSAGFGYDGKGQFTIHRAEQAAEAWKAVGEQEAVLEAFIDFEREVSVVATRTETGDFAHFGVVENQHQNHILDVTIAPGSVSDSIFRDAIEITRTILERLEVVGVLCVEFFLCKNGSLLVNELAPRPHNSGHYTFDANITSQFEQQLRSVCGLPLGSVKQLAPAAMANLLGDLWNDREPNWVNVCRAPNVKLHLYGKLAARPGRKMGHLTALAAASSQAALDVIEARKTLLAE